jgi:hypothetical protein
MLDKSVCNAQFLSLFDYVLYLLLVRVKKEEFKDIQRVYENS